MARFNARRFSSRRFFGTSDTVRVPEAGHYGILFTQGIYLRSTRHGAYYYTGLVPSPIRVLGKVRTTITATREKFLLGGCPLSPFFYATFQTLERVRDSFKANGKREFVPRDQFFPLLVVTIHYFYANFSLTPVLSIRIVLDNFYLPTTHFLFCENFNLNLTFASASFRRHKRP